MRGIKSGDLGGLAWDFHDLKRCQVNTNVYTPSHVESNLGKPLHV
jgi:hypothetical protein